MTSKKLFSINSFSEYDSVVQTLLDEKLLVGNCMGVLIGCSGHSPIPKDILNNLVTFIGESICIPHEIQTIWGGGDPFFSNKNRGGNITDLKQLLKERDFIKNGAAIQRTDWVSKCAPVDTVVVGYSKSMATDSEGKISFGGYQNTPTKDFSEFNEKFIEKNNSPFKPPNGYVPVCATVGYFYVLPSYFEKLICIVIMQAGFITYQEVKYLHHLLQENPSVPLKIYGVSWSTIGGNLNQQEKNGKCNLQNIKQELQQMNEIFGDEKVEILNLDC